MAVRSYDSCAYPAILDVGPYMAARSAGARASLYRLVGVVVHIGDGEYGHYYSYIRERGEGIGCSLEVPLL